MISLDSHTVLNTSTNETVTFEPDATSCEIHYATQERDDSVVVTVQKGRELYKELLDDGWVGVVFPDTHKCKCGHYAPMVNYTAHFEYYRCLVCLNHFTTK
jgi:hypothetical protein